jgi:hypothetical protein
VPVMRGKYNQISALTYCLIICRTGKEYGRNHEVDDTQTYITNYEISSSILKRVLH